MAVSVFKSTTKRECNIYGLNEPDPASIMPFQPSSSFSKCRFRRTRSFSDFSSRHLSDSVSAAGDSNSRRLNSLFRHGQVSTRHQSDESESDADSAYSRHTYRSRFNAEIGASRKGALQDAKTKESASSPLRQRMIPADFGHQEISDLLSCNDDNSDTESVFLRTTPRSHRAGAQSESESVFSRLSRPREVAKAEPCRTHADQNRKKKGSRAVILRRSTSQIHIPESFPSRGDRSDTESLYSCSTYGSHKEVNSGSSRIGSTRRKGTRQAALKRSLSQTELADFGGGRFRETPRQRDDADSPEETYFDMKLDIPHRDEETSIDHPVEEKTIRAVHTQNKEPRSQELDTISLYDAMRIEMRQAVSDIRNEIEQNSLSKDLDLQTPLHEGDARISLHDGADTDNDDDDALTVAEIRRDFAAKLEQSEKRAQELWTQLAAEECRCLDLVKVIKELLPAQPISHSKLWASSTVRPSMAPEVEKQLVSQSLGADAQRYFDECVSISGLGTISVTDCGRGYQDSEGGTCCQGSESPAWPVMDVSISPNKKNSSLSGEKKMVLLKPLISFCAQIEQTGRPSHKSPHVFARAAVNDDGLLLPWLKWETDPDFSFQEQIETEKMKDGHMIHISSQPLTTTSKPVTLWESMQSSQELQETQSLDLPPGVSGLGCVASGDLSSCSSLNFGHLRGLSPHSKYVKDRSQGVVDVEVFVLQRMRLSHRIKGGRLLLCGGRRT